MALPKIKKYLLSDEIILEERFSPIPLKINGNAWPFPGKLYFTLRQNTKDQIIHTMGLEKVLKRFFTHFCTFYIWCYDKNACFLWDCGLYLQNSIAVEFYSWKMFPYFVGNNSHNKYHYVDLITLIFGNCTAKNKIFRGTISKYFAIPLNFTHASALAAIFIYLPITKWLPAIFVHGMNFLPCPGISVFFLQINKGAK